MGYCLYEKLTTVVLGVLYFVVESLGRVKLALRRLQGSDFSPSPHHPYGHPRNLGSVHALQDGKKAKAILLLKASP